MDKQSNSSQERNAQDGNLGRFSPANNQDDNDISNVDQQEGNMKHGSTGGNFNERNKEQDDLKQKHHEKER